MRLESQLSRMNCQTFSTGHLLSLGGLLQGLCKGLPRRGHASVRDRRSGRHMMRSAQTKGAYLESGVAVSHSQVSVGLPFAIVPARTSLAGTFVFGRQRNALVALSFLIGQAPGPAPPPKSGSRFGRSTCDGERPQVFARAPLLPA